VSYRLSGFKPYLLNAPFDEKAILQHLRCDDGYIGIHADLAAIEPTITAHYSEDSSLLKVFRDGLGDIYLDLALELFPNDKELQEGYHPNEPISEAIKKRFSRQRKVAKVIQLAVAYTGTGHTVSKNLTKDGIPTSVPEADRLVQAYWRKFYRVAEFNDRLRELNRAQGYLRNVIGRIIRVPDPEYKDLSNRFIQSSAHDVLVLWVLEIYRLFEEAGIAAKPILLDCHDSTSNQVPKENVEAAKHIYGRALENINQRLGLCVTIKAEIKTFQTLAGLKAQE
jgi:DNA polymerase-1